MEDSHDFGWSAAKASHAVLLCRTEEAKVTWGETNKIDRIRRAHAQRIAPHSFSSSNSKKNNSRDRPTPCKFYQKGSCSHKADHESNGHFYLRVFPLFCPGKKTMPTQVLQVCCSKKRMRHCSNAVPVHKNDAKITKTRIIYSNINNNCASSNWRHDWWQINHKTYAKVLKGDNWLEYGNQEAKVKSQAFAFKTKQNANKCLAPKSNIDSKTRQNIAQPKVSNLMLLNVTNTT